MIVVFEKVRPVKSPKYSTDLSAGIDFFVPDDFPEVVIEPRNSINIPSGIKVKLPDNSALIAFNKSGIAINKLIVGAQVVDSDYQGEIHLHLINVGNTPKVIKPRQKIVQFIHVPIYLSILMEDTNIHKEETERGEGGFGSTGLH